MTRDEAEALATKRNAHKGKGLAHKEWRAIEEDGNWTVKLLDSTAHQIAKAQKEMNRAKDDAKMALMFGNFEGFREAAGRHLLARCAKTIAQYEESQLSEGKQVP